MIGSLTLRPMVSSRDSSMVLLKMHYGLKIWSLSERTIL